MKWQHLAPSLQFLDNFMDDFGVEAVDTIGGAEDLACNLFRDIEGRHGRTEARRIFRKFVSPPGARRLNQIKNESLLDRLDRMNPPNVQKLAERLAEENKALPPEQRHGPRGSINPTTLEKHIRRLRDKR